MSAESTAVSREVLFWMEWARLGKLRFVWNRTGPDLQLALAFDAIDPRRDGVDSLVPIAAQLAVDLVAVGPATEAFGRVERMVHERLAATEAQLGDTLERLWHPDNVTVDVAGDRATVTVATAGGVLRFAAQHQEGQWFVSWLDGLDVDAGAIRRAAAAQVN